MPMSLASGASLISMGDHNLKEALHAAHAALELLRKLHDAVNGIDERCDIQKVRHKLRGVDGAVHHEDGARNDDHDIHETVKKFIGGFKAAIYM